VNVAPDVPSRETPAPRHDIPIMLFHFNHQVRQMNIQVFKANGEPVHPVFNYVDQESFLPRNGERQPNNAGLGRFFEFDWDGTRSHDNGGGNGDRRKVVPNGTYVLKLSVLKALGDASNPAHWETFTPPPIKLARP
jgi:minor extracellular serine protease Vpr